MIFVTDTMATGGSDPVDELSTRFDESTKLDKSEKAPKEEPDEKPKAGTVLIRTEHTLTSSYIGRIHGFMEEYGGHPPQGVELTDHYYSDWEVPGTFPVSELHNMFLLFPPGTYTITSTFGLVRQENVITIKQCHEGTKLDKSEKPKDGKVLITSSGAKLTSNFIRGIHGFMKRHGGRPPQGVERTDHYYSNWEVPGTFPLGGLHNMFLLLPPGTYKITSTFGNVHQENVITIYQK